MNKIRIRNLEFLGRQNKNTSEVFLATERRKQEIEICAIESTKKDTLVG